MSEYTKFLTKWREAYDAEWHKCGERPKVCIMGELIFAEFRNYLQTQFSSTEMFVNTPGEIYPKFVYLGTTYYLSYSSDPETMVFGNIPTI